MDVRGFFGEFRFLSNFYEAKQVVRGVEYASNEHFFQASKAADKEDHDYIASAPSPGVAKARGKRITLRKDWNEVRLRVMRIGLRAKFEQNPDLKAKLLATGNGYLEETNQWNDKFWGKVGNEGFNHLGEMLMELRDLYQMDRFYG